MTHYNDRADKVAQRESAIKREDSIHVHKPIIDMVMCYQTREGKKHAHQIDMNISVGLVIRTLKWAARDGIEVTFRPV